MAKFSVVEGDLLDQNVEVVVNAWNRNPIPWWLLLPHGVSGAIKKRGGVAPFRELGWRSLPLGEARFTGAGKLPFKGIVHVAAINGWWRASEHSIRCSVRSALHMVNAKSFASVAFPLLGSGAGGFNADRSLEIMQDEIAQTESAAQITIVRFGAPKSRS